MALRPTGTVGAATRELAGRVPEAQDKGEFDPAHSNMSLTDGKAEPGKKPAPPAVQADGENLP